MAVVATSAPPSYFVDQAPAYQFTGSQSTPAYSDTADASELVLDSTTSSTADSTLARAETNQSVESDFIYRTDHMEVNLGSRIWGFRTPVYGREGHVEGSLKLSGEEAHVTSVQAKLLGDIIIRTSQFGQLAGQDSVRFLRRTITMYSSSRRSDSPVPWDGEHHFSFELPSHVDIKGKKTSLPSTFNSCLPSTFCEITFVLKIDMVRKGFLRRHETLRIPISYFPKSRPSQPSVMEIPWPLSHYGKNPFEGNASVRSITLSEMRCLPKIQSTGSESIHLSIPSPSCFTSGEDIPFILSMKFPQAPTAPALLTPNIRIELIKRTRISRLGGVEVAIRETAVGTAEIRNIMEPAEGITHLSGVLQGGRAGRESSWHVHGMADVQYVIRAIVRPPKNMLCHLPSWRSDVEVKMTTDLWGTLERELIATGGIPTPALAMGNTAARGLGHPLAML